MEGLTELFELSI